MFINRKFSAKNEQGQRTKVEYGNGAVSNYTYDPAMKRLTYLTTQAGGKTFQNIIYKYDGVGNIVSKTNSSFKTTSDADCSVIQAYDYTDLYWLKSSTGTYTNDKGVNSYTDAFTYDAIGNIATKIQTNNFTPNGGSQTAVPGTTYSYTYQYQSGRPHAASSTGERDYIYDANGNMISWLSPANQDIWMNLQWDVENRLIKTQDLKGIVTYKYDDKGKRIIKKSDLAETVYVNDNYTLRSDAVCKHIFAGNTRVATVLKTPSVDDSIYFYHGDHLGSSSIVTNKTGQFNEHLEYFPYGETWVQEKASSGTESMPYKFTGQILDDETGLYYFGQRYYEPRLSRWISADLILHQYLDGKRGMGGVFKTINLNLYHYSANNPMKYLDPDGLDFIIFYYSGDVDRSFERVALTKAIEVGQTGEPIIMRAVKSETDFKYYWNGIIPSKDVTGISIYTHGGKGELYFKPDNINDGSLRKNEILELKKFVYSENAIISIHSCKSAVGAEESTAQSFANSQNIITTGTLGYSSFSNNYNNYQRITNDSNELYLESYDRGRNNFFGDGNLLPQVEFFPQPDAGGGDHFMDYEWFYYGE